MADLFVNRDGSIDWRHSEISWAISPSPWAFSGAAFDYQLVSSTAWATVATTFGVTITRVDANVAAGARIIVKADGITIYDGPTDPRPVGGLQLSAIEFDRSKVRSGYDVAKIIDAANRASILDAALLSLAGRTITSLHFDTGTDGRRERVMDEALHKAIAAAGRPDCDLD